jgi:spermidine/putrescine transport system permease protein
MEAARLPAPVVAKRTRKRAGGVLRPLAFLAGPSAVLALLFVAPMAVMLVISLQYGVLTGSSGFTVTNYTNVFTDPLYREVAWTTFQIATIAMLIQLLIAVPIAYVLAFKAGRWELPLLLFLVLADELNPMVRIYAWRMLLGREGLINEGLQRIGLINHPIDALLFSKFAVIVVLSTSYLTYTVIPIYGAMKAIDKNIFEAALDLGAGWWTRTRRVLLPLIAPGIFVALLLVYIPLFTDFASPTLVGGTSGYMLGQIVNDLVLESGDLNGGAALSLLMLLASAIFAVVAFKLAKIRQLES